MKTLIISLLLTTSFGAYACAGFTLKHVFEKNQLTFNALNHFEIPADHIRNLVISDYSGTNKIYVCEENYQVGAVIDIFHSKDLNSEQKHVKVLVNKYGDFTDKNNSKFFINEL